MGSLVQILPFPTDQARHCTPTGPLAQVITGRPADDHPLDLRRALENREDPGGADSLCRSTACMMPASVRIQHGLSETNFGFGRPVSGFTLIGLFNGAPALPNARRRPSTQEFAKRADAGRVPRPASPDGELIGRRILRHG
jgi:hypothetical protein